MVLATHVHDLGERHSSPPIPQTNRSKNCDLGAPFLINLDIYLVEARALCSAKPL